MMFGAVIRYAIRFKADRHRAAKHPTCNSTNFKAGVLSLARTFVEADSSVLRTTNISKDRLW